MSTELNRRLSNLAERGEWRGADTLMARARARLDPATARLSPEQERRWPSWALAVGAAALVLLLIGGAAVLFLRAAPEQDVIDVTTTPPVTTSAVSTTAPATTAAPTTLPPLPRGPVAWERVFLGDAGAVAAVIPGGPGLIAAGTSGGAAAVWTSRDGLSWERVPHDEAVFGGGDEGAFGITDLVAGPDGYLAVGGGRLSGGNRPREVAIWRSGDGFAWERIALDEAVVGVRDYVSVEGLAYGPAGYVVVGWEMPEDPPGMIAGHYVLHSVDGRTWQRVDLSSLPQGGGMDAVVAGGPGYVAVGHFWREPSYSSPAVWTSPDGVAWALLDAADVPRDPRLTSAFQDIADVGIAPDGHLVGVGVVTAWRSTDGLTWEPLVEQWASGGENPFVTAVVPAGLQIVAVGGFGSLPEPGVGCTGFPPDPAAGAVWLSDDGGARWLLVDEPTLFGDGTGSAALLDVTEGDGFYIAVGYWDGEATAWVGRWAEGGES